MIHESHYCQAEFNLRSKEARKGVNKDAITELCQLLRGRGWVTARELQALRPEWNERFIRLLADNARPAVLSAPGTPGYCLSSEASDEELQHTGRRQISQGRHMARSGIAYLRIWSLRKATENAEKPKG